MPLAVMDILKATQNLWQLASIGFLAAAIYWLGPSRNNASLHPLIVAKTKSKNPDRLTVAFWHVCSCTRARTPWAARSDFPQHVQPQTIPKPHLSNFRLGLPKVSNLRGQGLLFTPRLKGPGVLKTMLAFQKVESQGKTNRNTGIVRKGTHRTKNT